MRTRVFFPATPWLGIAVFIIGLVGWPATLSAQTGPGTAVAPASRPCGLNEVAALEPDLVRMDTSMLRVYAESRNERIYAAESTMIQIIEDLLYEYSATQCSPTRAGRDETGPSLELYAGFGSERNPFATPGQTGGLVIDAATRFRVFGERVIRQPGSNAPSAVRIAYPVTGAVSLGEILRNRPQDLEILLQDLKQIDIVSIPRIEQVQSLDGEVCYRIRNNPAFVPVRAFNEELSWPQSTPASIALLPLKPGLSMQAWRESLEQVARDVNWNTRVDMRRPTQCVRDEPDAYSETEIQGLRNTLRPLVAGSDFLDDAWQFWSRLRERIEQLRRWDAPNAQVGLLRGDR